MATSLRYHGFCFTGVNLQILTYSFSCLAARGLPGKPDCFVFRIKVCSLFLELPLAKTVTYTFSYQALSCNSGRLLKVGRSIRIFGYLLRIVHRSPVSEPLGTHTRVRCNRSTLKCLNFGTPKTINFPFVPNGKFMFLGIPIF